MKDKTNHIANTYLVLTLLEGMLEESIDNAHFTQGDKQAVNNFRKYFRRHIDRFWNVSDDNDKHELVEFGHTMQNIEKLPEFIGKLNPPCLHVAVDFMQRLAANEYDNNPLVYDFTKVYAEMKSFELYEALADNLRRVNIADLGIYTIKHDGKEYTVCDVENGVFYLATPEGTFITVQIQDISIDEVLRFNNAIYKELIEFQDLKVTKRMFPIAKDVNVYIGEEYTDRDNSLQVDYVFKHGNQVLVNSTTNVEYDNKLGYYIKVSCSYDKEHKYKGIIPLDKTVLINQLNEVL